MMSDAREEGNAYKVETC